jgi:outer membrane protein OmpA-like peptidoglycan-associated protein
MKSKKIIIIATLFATLTATAQSQHEVSIQAGGGLSSLQYKPTIGKSTPGIGLDAGVAYTYFFNSHWGIGTGAGIKLLTGKYKLPSLTDAFQSNDGTEAFEYRYSLNKYSEKQQALSLTIPLMVHFQSGKFYAALGGKVGLPLSANYKNDLDELQAAGYYAHDDLLLNDPEFMGFGTFNKLSHKANLSLKTAFFASAEVGVKWRLSDKLHLYTGIFVDYGLNNIRKNETVTTLIEYNDATADAYLPNSILASGVDNQDFVDKITPLAAGIKLSLAFVVGKSHQKSAPKAEPTSGYQPEVPSADEILLAAQRAEAEKAEAARAEEAAAEQRLAEQQKLEAAEKAVAQQKYVAAVTQVEQPVNGYKIGATALATEMKSELDDKAELLQRYPAAKLIVEGHTCNIGTHQVNIQVGLRRAEIAKEYLIKQGVSADRITTVSKAENEPIAPNDTETNRQKNRRVVLKVVD